MTTRELIESLRGTRCPADGCGRTKKPAMSFCGACYFRLYSALRKAIYRKVGAGYEEAMAEAIEFLKGGGEGAEAQDEAIRAKFNEKATGSLFGDQP